MSKTAVFCIAKTFAQAERIVERLQISGFQTSEISVVYPEGSSHTTLDTSKQPRLRRCRTGAASGGLAGGVIGLLAGIGALAIPGVGPFIAAGPIMAALSGAAVGATAGGIVGGWWASEYQKSRQRFTNPNCVKELPDCGACTQ